VLHDRTGKPRLQFDLLPDDSPRLFLADTDQQIRARLKLVAMRTRFHGPSGLGRTGTGEAAWPVRETQTACYLPWLKVSVALRYALTFPWTPGAWRVVPGNPGIKVERSPAAP